MLRIVALSIGVVLLVLGFALRQSCWVLLIYGGVITLSVLFERYHYRKRLDAGRGQWKATGERFIDPGTDMLTEVFYNEETGERDYRTKQ